MRAIFRPRFLILCLLACAGFVLSCNKSNSNNSSSPSSVETSGDDQARVSSEMDAVSNDANTSLNSQASVSGNSWKTKSLPGISTTLGDHPDSAGAPNDSLICDASVVIDTTVNPRTVTITYNGSNCWGNRTRTGVVVISIPAGEHWGDVGASVTISIQNLKITRLRDNTSIILNGSKTMTNVSGGLMVNLPNLGSITHTISAENVSITFPNGSQRTWNVSKQRVFTYNNGIVITTTGTHSDNANNTNVAEWGTNRFGIVFESLISQAKVIRQDCDFRLVSGQNEILRSDSLNASVTYGLDAQGNATTCPGSGTYYLEIVVTTPNGRTTPFILPY